MLRLKLDLQLPSIAIHYNFLRLCCQVLMQWSLAGICRVRTGSLWDFYRIRYGISIALTIRSLDLI